MDQFDPQDAGKAQEDSASGANASDSRSLVPASSEKSLRAPIIIEGRASESPEPPKADGQRAAATGGANAGITHWLAAGVALVALCAGLGGGLALGGKPKETAELADLRTKIAAMDAQLASQDAAGLRNHVAALKVELDKARAAAATQNAQVAARIDKLDHDTAARFDREGAATGARFDKIEKSLMARDATASIHALPVPPQPPAPAIAPPGPAASAQARSHVPPGGWVLLGVRDGIATVEGPRGIFEVQPGDTLPGAGRVRAFERRAGQWVLVTNQGYVDQNGY